ncbi:MAG: DUF4249 family protein [Bacteroidales bacterium]|nr:DUF4249 family protein [Bacteroidales bacterium]
MNKAFLILALTIIVVWSCREPYKPDIDTDQQVLVIDAFLTNYPGYNFVKLTLAVPYDSAGAYPAVSNATVYLTDNTDSVFYFEETGAGYYEPVTFDFEGVINKSYILTVIAPDGNTYVSKPETLLPEMQPSNVYGGYYQAQHLRKNSFGQMVMETEDVCALYFDYEGDTLTPRFRYNSSQLVEYYLIKELINFFCCWQTHKDNNLRFTNEKYTSSSFNIYKQEVCITQPYSRIEVKDLCRDPDDPGTWIYSDQNTEVYEYKRIAKINQYRLNNDSYNYYREVDEQSRAGGKIFDPVISQLKGNITCSNDASKLIFGFFEASTLSTMSYIIKRNGIGRPVELERIENVAPSSPEGFMLSQTPDFWVQ